ncbi:hypothetical protein ACVGOW_34435 [Pseudonocardia saturnea]
MTDPDAPDVRLLADLDAGLLDPARAREVRRAALADPRSAAVLDALAATRADLAAVPVPVAPPDLVAGWMAALGTAGVRPEDPAGDATPDSGTADGSAPARGEDLGVASAPTGPAAQHPAPHPAAQHPAPHPAAQHPAPQHSPGDDAGPVTGPPPPAHPVRPAPGLRPRYRGPRPTTPRRRGWVLLAAAAALVVGVLALPAGPPDLTRVELAGFARSTVGTTDLGVLADPARRDGCLSAAGHPGAVVLGGRQVRLDGTPGVLLVLSTGELGAFRVLVVTSGCAVLADDVVGR